EAVARAPSGSIHVETVVLCKRSGRAYAITPRLGIHRPSFNCLPFSNRASATRTQRTRRNRVTPPLRSNASAMGDTPSLVTPDWREYSTVRDQFKLTSRAQ